MSNSEFQQIIIEARKKYTDLQLAGYLKTSCKTVQRWADGTVIPPPLSLKPIIDTLGDIR